jgi:murein DD-endopeptidase MepM/ murein hydrolase activator NlpD
MLNALRCSALAFALLCSAACLAPAARTQPIGAAPRAEIDVAEVARSEDTQPLELALPVDGVWIVSQGYHGTESHRGHAAYALDLVKLDAEGRAYARSGRRTQDWYSFGAEVHASADGVVVRAIDRFPDNPAWAKGKDTNSVIVRHRAVLSEYVHIQQGSLRVREGDRVSRGQVIARCGNSGSETPHLHWALLSSLEPIRTRPAIFAPYEVRDADGTWRTAGGVPSAHDVIRKLAPPSP